MQLHLLLGASAIAALATPCFANDVVKIASSDHGLSTLVSAVKAADLVEALQGKGPFTLLAPTNEAFAAIGDKTLQELLKPENKEALRSILLFHVVPGSLNLDQIEARRSLPTLNGQRIDVGMEEGRSMVDGARFDAINRLADNGFVHTIDRVLLPADQDLVQLASGAGQFKTLLAAAKAAGLVKALQGDGPLTVLAPTDEAFAALGHDTLDELLRPENKSKLARILTYHVFEGRIYADDAIRAGSAPTLAGAPVSFSIADGRLTAGGANVLANDLDASNGVVHVIDAVLLPPKAPAPRGRLVIGYESERPSAALAAQLGIDRAASVLVSKVNREESGLQRYDVITRVEGEPYTSDRLAAAKERAGYQGKVNLELIRAGKVMHLAAPVDIDPH